MRLTSGLLGLEIQEALAARSGHGGAGCPSRGCRQLGPECIREPAQERLADALQAFVAKLKHPHLNDETRSPKRPA
jgi:hypothetical protein